MDHPLQDRLPTAPWMEAATRRLPGVQPLDPDHWLIRDEAYAGQMAERRRLLSEAPDAVLALQPEARDAALELRQSVLDWLGARDPGYRVAAGRVICPDGCAVPLRGDAEGSPLEDLGRIVQEDFCLLQRTGPAAEHVLFGAVLCFPASWTLAEKLGRPLTAIHAPVAAYDGAMAARVQRLFDAVRVGHPLWRQNALIYRDPALFQPRREAAAPRAPGGGYLRSERQSLWRLPESGAVVFSIHTYLVPLERLTPAQRAGLGHVGHVT